MEPDAQSVDTSEDNDPPFRKTGYFDPYSDDPRLAIKKLFVCSKTGTIVIGGTAGAVIILGFSEAVPTDPIKITSVNLVSTHDNFVWKGHDQLDIKLKEHTKIQDSIKAIGIVQIFPPAAVTCLELQTDWGLVAAGTAHGLLLFDYKNHNPVLHKCTLNPHGM